jgi:cation-transporting ATPase 13A1
VASPVIRQASLHVPLPIILRFYVWLFILLYGVYLWAVIFHHESLFGSSSEGRNLALVILCSLNALAFLVTHWSVTAKARMTCYEVKDPFKAKVIRVIPEKHHGAGALCEIKRQIILDEEDNMVGSVMKTCRTSL